MIWTWPCGLAGTELSRSPRSAVCFIAIDKPRPAAWGPAARVGGRPCRPGHHRRLTGGPVLSRAESGQLLRYCP